MNIDFESRNITRRSFLKGAGVVGAAGLLSACGGSKSNNSGSTAASGVEAPNSTGATPLKEYISWESANREIESWNLLYSQTLSDANVVTNLWDGLMSFDCYGKLVPAIGAYLKEVEGNSFMAQLKADGKVSFTVDGSEVVLEMDDVLVDTAEKDGFVSSGDNNLTVVLDTNLTPELVEEGFVREIVSKVQTMRKEADFNVTDRIRVYYDGNARIAEILAANDIKGDVLAVEVVAGKGGELSKEWNINGEKVTLGVARV